MILIIMEAMGDFKEDLLDTLAIFKNKLSNQNIISKLALLTTLLIWPVLYTLLKFSLIKLIISAFGSIFLIAFAFKKIK